MEIRKDTLKYRRLGTCNTKLGRKKSSDGSANVSFIVTRGIH